MLRLTFCWMMWPVFSMGAGFTLVAALQAASISYEIASMALGCLSNSEKLHGDSETLRAGVPPGRNINKVIVSNTLERRCGGEGWQRVQLREELSRYRTWYVDRIGAQISEARRASVFELLLRLENVTLPVFMGLQRFLIADVLRLEIVKVAEKCAVQEAMAAGVGRNVG